MVRIFICNDDQLARKHRDVTHILGYTPGTSPRTTTQAHCAFFACFKDFVRSRASVWVVRWPMFLRTDTGSWERDAEDAASSGGNGDADLNDRGSRYSSSLSSSGSVASVSATGRGLGEWGILATGVVGKDLDKAAFPPAVVGVDRFDVKESEDWRSAVCMLCVMVLVKSMAAYEVDLEAA